MDLGLLAAVAEPILSKLTSFAFQQIALASSVNQDFANFKSKVTRISALLLDAQNAQLPKHKSVAVWIQQMTDAIYDADDVLEKFNYETLLKKKIQNNPIKGTINCFSTSNPIYARFKNAHLLKDINMRLDQVVKDGTDLVGLTPLVLRPGIGESSAQQDPRQTRPIGDVSMILGRDDDKAKVLQMLLQSSGDFSAVAIVGLAGLGKTTLATHIYKDTDNTKFDKRIWVCVSTDFDVNAILKAMVAHLEIECGENNMIKKLTEKLSKKKCLLILDDVWPHELSKWDKFKDLLFEIGADKKESKILVTTRNEEVALSMHCSPYLLKGLSEDDSLSLFGKRAFWNKGEEEIARVRAIGEKILNRCKGVPLAILTLGALLQTKRENEWSSIAEITQLWDLSRDENDGIMPALRLSYEHFPPYLKPCFAYCSIFPKDHVFMKDDLIQLWIAQGFIQSTGGRETMLDKGNECFDLLLWDSFFQDVKKHNYGNVRTCKMHDLVHDLAITITKKECLVFDESNVINSLNENDAVRHLHLLEKKGTTPKISNGRKLRTLFLACEMRQGDSQKFECLRVLNFENARRMKELPESIGKLKSLRYLNVSKTSIQKFPNSILDLYSLQTIRFMGCKHFEGLPERLGSMISLTHLCFDNYYPDKKMPFELSRLTGLETLSIFNVGRDKGHKIEELGSLKRLRGEFHIKYLDRIEDPNEAKSANIMMKTNLFKLILEWSGERSDSVRKDEEVLAGLEPPPNLRSLTIQNFDGSNFPRWMLTGNVFNGSKYVQLECLVEIKLISCEKCERIPTLGELPRLKFLEIGGMNNLKTIGRDFYSNNKYDVRLVCGGGSSSSCITLFPLLVTLKLDNLNNLVEWNEASTSADMGAEGGMVEVFPKLEDLSIKRCSQLKNAPTHFPFIKTLIYEYVESGEALNKICKVTTTLTSLRIAKVSYLTHLPEGLLENNKNLTQIYVEDCGMLESITREDDDVGLQNLLSLQRLTIGSCPKLSHIRSMRGLTALQDLSLAYCGEIRNLPIGLGSCTSLKNLKVWDCKNLGDEGLMELQSLNSLNKLTISYANSEFESFPFNFNTSMLKTSRLDLGGWKSVPQQIQHLTALEELSIYYFEELEAFPDCLGNLSSLQSLAIENCPKLSLIGSMHGLTSLIELRISSCDEITKLPIGLGSCTSLETLEVRNCKNLISFVAEEEELRELKSLSKLSIFNCGKLKGDLQLEGSLHRLKELRIGGFESELESIPFNFNLSVLQTSLKSLYLYGWPKLKSLPQPIKQLAALERLRINGFSGLKALPDWLENLSSLQHLEIQCCENLKYLPSVKSMRRLTNLERLNIVFCKVLEERCKKKSGPEWSKISHIPHIFIDGEEVQDLR